MNYKELVAAAIKTGYTVSVYDGEEWAVKRSTNFAEIVEMVDAVEEAGLRFRDGKNIVGWALIIPSLDPSEEIADCWEKTAEEFGIY